MRKLESLLAWKVGQRTALATYRLTLEPPFAKHHALCDQLRRAALSVPANIAEGYALGTRQQLIRCLRMALGSAAELQGHLTLVRELGLVEATRTSALRADCDRLVGLIVGLLKKLGARVPPSPR